MNILGVTLGHDTSFALVRDDEVVGVLEAEKHFRQKRYKLSTITLAPGKHVYLLTKPIGFCISVLERQ